MHVAPALGLLSLQSDSCSCSYPLVRSDAERTRRSSGDKSVRTASSSVTTVAPSKARIAAISACQATTLTTSQAFVRTQPAAPSTALTVQTVEYTDAIDATILSSSTSCLACA